ncbi:YcjF family protein [Aureimonas phyllosphaerae]|uniref:Putative membrane protein n=1 Tax=Aureimonas phyllosphaerae TaxID=1166078 RepID=A0A7W6BWV3_9HYPH|nr:TIGR01620 family protein [Aureimonas phyllosphaerae]MBB3935216.1 putative membrane protein [Aureimonas phyllosphaerae]MBB3959224.1 putative membrane protein [Aureimonas phyllosphaerae]SFF06261.1 putative membrane protein [Aureimonas phyllosphaerae]
MSDTPSRRPSAFPVDPPLPQPPIATARAPRSISDLARVQIEPDEALEAEAAARLDAEPATRRRRTFSFGKLAMGALGALASLAFGLAIDSFVRDLFQRSDWLGWTALGLAVLLLVGLLGVVGREALGIMRLNDVERERSEGRRAFETDSAKDAQAVVAKLTKLVSARPETAAGRERLHASRDDVIDGRNLITLAERELLLPLDARARALVLASSKRVSVVTAVSPRAFMDLAFVLFETVRLIRSVSSLYGARPGAIGLVRLVRDVLAHLAVTGSIAVGDGIVGQVVGHGLAARLSAKLGEGLVNGLLTARIGIAAMDLCRPLPFLSVQRPRIGDFLNELKPMGGEKP